MGRGFGDQREYPNAVSDHHPARVPERSGTSGGRIALGRTRDERVAMSRTTVAATMSPMGSFLEHLEETTRDLRALERKERLERAENRAILARRNATRGPAGTARSDPQPATKPELPGS